MTLDQMRRSREGNAASISWLLRESSLLRRRMGGSHHEFDFWLLAQEAQALQPSVLIELFDTGELLLQNVALGAWRLDQRPFEPEVRALDSRILDAVRHPGTDPELVAEKWRLTSETYRE